MWGSHPISPKPFLTISPILLNSSYFGYFCICNYRIPVDLITAYGLCDGNCSTARLLICMPKCILIAFGRSIRFFQSIVAKLRNCTFRPVKERERPVRSQGNATGVLVVIEANPHASKVLFTNRRLQLLSPSVYILRYVVVRLLLIVA